MPLAMLAISWGQYIWIAMVVNIWAIPGDRPWLVTLAAAAAKLPPGPASIGQIDWPTAIAFPGSPKSIPAWLSALMKLSSVAGSASAGAANAAAAVSSPAAEASRRMARGWWRNDQAHP